MTDGELYKYPTHMRRLPDTGRHSIDYALVDKANGVNHDWNLAHRVPVHVKQILLWLAAHKQLREGLSEKQKENAKDLLYDRIMSAEGAWVLGPGLMMNSILERAIPQDHYTVTINTDFKYPLLVPMIGKKRLRIYKSTEPTNAEGLEGLSLDVVVKANGILEDVDDESKDVEVMHARMTAYPNHVDKQAVYDKIVQPAFKRLGLNDKGATSEMSEKIIGQSEHETYVSPEDLRRYAYVVSGLPIDIDIDVPLTPQLLTFKLARVLTMAGENLARDKEYIAKITEGRRRPDQQKQALKTLVEMEEEKGVLGGVSVESRVNQLMAEDFKIYSSQSATFDPRQQQKAGKDNPYTQFAYLTDLVPRKGSHTFVCEGMQNGEGTPRLFAGEANIVSQPLFPPRVVDVLKERGLAIDTLQPYDA